MPKFKTGPFTLKFVSTLLLLRGRFQNSFGVWTHFFLFDVSPCGHMFKNSQSFQWILTGWNMTKIMATDRGLGNHKLDIKLFWNKILKKNSHWYQRRWPAWIVATTNIVRSLHSVLGWAEWKKRNRADCCCSIKSFCRSQASLARGIKEQSNVQMFGLSS